MPGPVSRLPLKPLLGLLLLDGLGLAALACGFYLNEGVLEGAQAPLLALPLIAVGALALVLSLVLLVKLARHSSSLRPRN